MAHPISNPPLAVVKTLLFVLALIPCARTLLTVIQGQAIDPVAFMTHATGDWTLIFLMLTLAITPLRRLGAPGWIVRLRRMLGLFAFFYGCLHFAIYLVLDQFFNPAAIAHDVVKRPFITAGFTALLLMTPLAITSTDGWIRRLKRHWARLHRLVYAVALLGVVHYWWLVKRDLRQPILFAAILAVLLGLRLIWAVHRRWQAKKPCPSRHGLVN
ncbi:MAG: sulfoxide reductase heme-binding subunit YedZ [Paludibacterium sp.]|uniref:sulfite oxidase heme-binding subunit YedZ n=1 Tax=Paludibacterium sp. TaxID=1917523 RepID=UPI0025E87FC0|nr:protein-methionine-sulfoxide reductase heme-binding subunit MsrQ [Paludibacterium sp.]MBV8047248.1 sulfoxide reductase heme-binding subunit YedZ [Paludibacterium sp.]MBV8647921.1 sulfoxide reductase heme-binding subunit YedZ [Paludibacterium sp.]